MHYRVPSPPLLKVQLHIPTEVQAALQSILTEYTFKMCGALEFALIQTGQPQRHLLQPWQLLKARLDRILIFNFKIPLIFTAVCLFVILHAGYDSTNLCQAHASSVCTCE